MTASEGEEYNRGGTALYPPTIWSSSLSSSPANRLPLHYVQTLPPCQLSETRTGEGGDSLQTPHEEGASPEAVTGSSWCWWGRKISSFCFILSPLFLPFFHNLGPLSFGSVLKVWIFPGSIGGDGRQSGDPWGGCEGSCWFGNENTELKILSVAALLQRIQHIDWMIEGYLFFFWCLSGIWSGYRFSAGERADWRGLSDAEMQHKWAHYRRCSREVGNFWPQQARREGGNLILFVIFCLKQNFFFHFLVFLTFSLEFPWEMSDRIIQVWWNYVFCRVWWIKAVFYSTSESFLLFL